MTDPIRPKGVDVTLTSSHQILIEFNHGDIPPVVLGNDSAAKLGSVIASQADRAGSKTPPKGRNE